MIPNSLLPKQPTNWRKLFEARWGLDFVEQRLAKEDRLRRGDLPTRFFAHEIEESHQIFKVVTLLLQLLELHSVGVKNALDIQLTHQNFALPSLHRTFRPFRILQLSDLHIDGHQDFGSSVYHRLKGLQFDMVILTGDFSFELADDFTQTFQELSQLIPLLQCPYGIYGILGNHDSIHLVPVLESLGIRMLVNERIRIETPQGYFWLLGVDDPHHFQLNDLPKTLTGISPKEPLLLLSHSPEIIPQASTSGIDLYLTGHTHGGQFCLPGGRSLFINARCERKYTRGLWDHDNMRGYTTSGTGSSGIFARYNCPPEICIHTIIPKR